MENYIGYIKWVTMILGASRGNLYGGVIGFTVGYFIEQYLKDKLSIESENVFKHKEYKYSSYQKNILALISEVVKADGYIHKQEIYFIKNYLFKQFGSIYCNMMLKSLKIDIDKNFNIEKTCLNLKNSIDYKSKIKLLIFLHGITLQNNQISNNEKKIIEIIAKIIGLSNIDYEKIIYSKKSNQKKSTTTTRKQSTLYNPYKILGIKENATKSEIKKAYRKMVLKYHPDKTDIDDDIAVEKFSAVSEAYNIIKVKRGFK